MKTLLSEFLTAFIETPLLDSDLDIGSPYASNEAVKGHDVSNSGNSQLQRDKQRWGESRRIAYGMLTTTIAIGVLFSLLWYTQRRKLPSTDGHRLPPGPRTWPVIGNLHLLAQEGKLPHHALATLAKEYGPLMTLRLGSHTTVVATSANMAKEILKTQNQHFASRAQTAAGEIMNYNRMNVVWAPYGDYLRAVRKIVQTELLSVKRIASFENLREEEIWSSVLSILEECKEGTVSITLDEKMSQLSTNNMSRMIFGKSFFRRNSDSFTDKHEFMELVRGIFRQTGMFVIGDFIPVLKRFDIQGHEAKMSQLARQADKFYSRILEEHRSQKNDQPDFVDTLLSLPANQALSETAMKGLIADMIFAGTDTSANQICWTFAELMRHPEIVQKARQELDSVVGRDRMVKEADIPNLKYVQAIVKESFRLHPVSALLPYESTTATHVAGFHIPSKTRIFVNNYAISRDPGSWEKPLDFLPERFLEGSCTRDVKGQDFELLPFGSGRRMCVGMNLGLLMVQFTVAQLLHTCNWSLPVGMGPEDVDLTEDFGISTPLKTPLKLIATPRLAPSVVNDVPLSTTS